MNESEPHNSGVSDEAWRRWLEKSKRRDHERAQRARPIAGLAVVLLLCAVGFYLTRM